MIKRILCRFRGFLLLLGICIGALIVVICSQKFGIPLCPFKKITGIPCPGCGGVRCVRMLLHGDVMGAILTNPVSVVFILFIIASLMWLFLDGLKNEDSYKKVILGKWNPRLTAVVLGTILVCWIWNIFKVI